MAKYKVCFSGFAYIEADSPEEAEAGYPDDAIFEELRITKVREVDEFVVDL